MLLLPIGRDDAVVQRHAWISYAIIALNVVIWLAGAVAESGGGGGTGPVVEQWRSTMRYYMAHPYLRVPDSIATMVPDRLRADAREAGPAPQNADVKAEQKAFDDMAEELSAAYHSIPRIRWSYIPAEGSVVTIFTSMFFHTGFMHLLGNMLFFFVTGPFIEDVFGRPLFAFLYFSGGAAATLWYASKHPGSSIPLMGASGAIAAVMGASLVRFLKTKLEFIFIPFLFRPTFNVRFFVPAFVVLPLWFAEQFLLSTSESSGAGVAFSAHVGGFVYGFCLALLVKVTGFEDKFVAPVVEKQTSWKMDDRLVQAMAARDVGNLEEARRNVGALLAAKPNDIDALRLAVDVSREASDDRALDGYATRLLSRYVEEKQDDAARELIHEFGADRLPRFLARAAQFAERGGDREWAISLYERLCNTETTVGSLVKLGTLRKLNGDLRGARTALTQARQLPDCSPEWSESIDAKLHQLG
jgi:membrane associated rhomboid family serine protease